MTMKQYLRQELLRIQTQLHARGRSCHRRLHRLLCAAVWVRAQETQLAEELQLIINVII